MPKIDIIHGPNLNLLGIRETTIYGNMSLEKINNDIMNLARELKIEVSFFQANCEGKIVERIHEAYQKKRDGIIINPAAYTHTSIAIRDAISAISLPVIEVHLSNTHSREKFRHKSYLASVCIGRIEGLGKNSYLLALRAFSDRFAL